MNYGKNFVEALSKGEVVVRKAWVNTNSKKNQLSVQFMQQIEKDTEGTPNLLIGIAQGMGDLSKNLVTTIFSFEADVAANLGLEEKDYFEDDEVITGKSIFGTDVSIKVEENTTKNPLSESQTPKLNPKTEEVLTYKGSPIYRHTTLVQGKLGKEDHTYLQHDNSGVEVESRREMMIGQEPS